MNKFIIEITEPAESDLKNIRLYIEEELLEPNTAIKIIDEIGESIVSLEELPMRNALVCDARLAKLGIRRAMVKNYIIFYIVDEKESEVTIIRILYSKRNWINLL